MDTEEQVIDKVNKQQQAFSEAQSSQHPYNINLNHSQQNPQRLSLEGDINMDIQMMDFKQDTTDNSVLSHMEQIDNDKHSISQLQVSRIPQEKEEETKIDNPFNLTNNFNR